MVYDRDVLTNEIPLLCISYEYEYPEANPRVVVACIRSPATSSRNPVGVIRAGVNAGRQME